jgi:hypothetical protein
MIDEARADTSSTSPLATALRRGGHQTAQIIETEAAEPGSEHWSESPGELSDQERLGPPGQAPAPSPAAPFDSPCAELARLLHLSAQMAAGMVRLTTACVRSAGHSAQAPIRALAGERR